MYAKRYDPLYMIRQAFLFLACLFLFPSFAGAERVEEVWLFRTEQNISEWHYAGLEEGTLTQEGLQFSITDQAAIFRALPADFDRTVDGIKVYIDPIEGVEASLLLMQVEEAENVRKRIRIALTPEEGDIVSGFYVPLTYYKKDLKGMNTIAISLMGKAENVSFGGVRLFGYSPLEKLQGAFRSFLIFEPFRPHMINLLIGPVIMPDPMPLPLTRETLPLSTSVNAYFLVFIALSGIVLLLYAVFLARVRGKAWPELRAMILTRFFLSIAAVWVLYDLRMGYEFLRAVSLDHTSYISAPADTRTFRDMGRFYEFAAFATPFTSDRDWYELFAPDSFQYFGLMQYHTYPSLPNDGEPVSDTWVIYQRSDITLGEDSRLYHAGEAFTAPGVLLLEFDESSFVFRETSL